MATRKECGILAIVARFTRTMGGTILFVMNERSSCSHRKGPTSRRSNPNFYDIANMEKLKCAYVQQQNPAHREVGGAKQNVWGIL